MFFLFGSRELFSRGVSKIFHLPLHRLLRQSPLELSSMQQAILLSPNSRLLLLKKSLIDFRSFTHKKTSSSRANTLAVSPGISFSGKAWWISSLNIMGSENYFANSTVVCFGELLVDFVPTVGGLALADAPAFKKAPGGAPANVAVGICKLGGTAAFVGKVGEDEFGLMLVNVLKTNKVEVKGVRFDANARTALAFVTLKADGEREFMFYRNPSADMVMRPEELDVELIKHAKVFHFGSISLIAEPTKSTHMAAMKIAKDAGILLSYDPNLRLPLWSSPEAAREGIMSIWNQADIIKVSDEEVNFLTNGGDETLDDVVLELWHPGLKLLVVTDGPEGCRYYTPEFHGKVESFKVHPVDTTGAGDAFMAGLLSKLVDNDFGLLHHEGKLRDALRFANGCGAITTTERGAIPALPDTETVLRLMSKESM